MNYQHKSLSTGRFNTYPFFAQMAHIGSEVERAILWRNKNQDYSKQAFFRALELLDLTIADPKNKSRLKELVRVREVLADYFVFDNQYSSTDKLWQSYFYHFSYAARKNL